MPRLTMSALLPNVNIVKVLDCQNRHHRQCLGKIRSACGSRSTPKCGPGDLGQRSSFQYKRVSMGRDWDDTAIVQTHRGLKTITDLENSAIPKLDGPGWSLERELGNFEHYLATSVAGLTEFVSLSGFGQRKHLFDHWLNFPRINQYCEFSQEG
jgi:hypothetical protein